MVFDSRVDHPGVAVGESGKSACWSSVNASRPSASGAVSVDRVPQIANVNAVAAALRDWVINLHKERDDTGVQAAHVVINGSIGTPGVPGFPTAQPEEISPVYWDLHRPSATPELVFSP
ncbi:hypothetical protein AB0L61_39910 [Streptomyces tendae]|uniref:hypothetical protein n=1 Tax=Streptomyces tendae TaxID=1932 RepID=UPI003423A576